MQNGSVWPEVNACTPCVQMHQLDRDGPTDGLEQIGAVDEIGRLPVEFLAPAHVFRRKHAPVLPATELPASFDRNGCSEKSVQLAESPQKAHRVGRDHHASTDLFQLRGLLVHSDVEASLVKETRGRESPDTAAHDSNR
jgi:hypothetical protein